MNNLAEQQEHPLTMVDLLPLMQSAMNREADEFNNLADGYEQLEQKLRFMEAQVKNLTQSNSRLLEENNQLSQGRKRDQEKEKEFNKKAEMVSANAEKHMQLLEQKDRELIQAKNQLLDMKTTNKAYKEIANTPKKVREKIKALQEKAVKQQGFIAQHKATIKSLEHEKNNLKKAGAALSRQLDELDYTNVYSKNGDNVAIFPVMQKTNIGQASTENKQVPLLYLDEGGVGAIYLLNEDGEPSRSPTPRSGIKPKKETLEIMGTLLRKFKRNGNVVHADDLKMLECE